MQDFYHQQSQMRRQQPATLKDVVESLILGGLSSHLWHPNFQTANVTASLFRLSAAPKKAATSTRKSSASLEGYELQDGVQIFSGSHPAVFCHMLPGPISATAAWASHKSELPVSKTPWQRRSPYFKPAMDDSSLWSYHVVRYHPHPYTLQPPKRV